MPRPTQDPTTSLGRRGILEAGGGALALSALAPALGSSPANAASGTPADLPRDRRLGRLAEVHRFFGPMPTGVTVSHDGRIFVNYPMWGDPVRFTVGEIRDGREVVYPDLATNSPSGRADPNAFVSVQSVVVDPANRLWALDTGSPNFLPTRIGGPKLVRMSLARNAVEQAIVFPRPVALPTTYLNDVRFDLRRGRAGMAFITDSSDDGPNGIIVVDLASGQSWRRLNNHPSTKAGRPARLPPLRLCPLASRRIYSVSVDAIADRSRSEASVAATVADHGDKGSGSDGLESDDRDRVYLTAYEQNAIFRRDVDGHYDTVVHDPRLLWPDTMSVATDGYLYVTANQLHRQPDYHRGHDLRVKPYSLFRMPIDAGPVLLK